MPDREPNYPRRRVLVALLVIVILAIGIGTPVAILRPVPSADPSVLRQVDSTTGAADAAAPQFGYSAVGAVGTPGVLATYGSQAPHSIASITKMITSLVVLEKKPLDGTEAGPTITYTQNDVDILQQVLADDGSYADVQAGWKLTERQSFQSMLLPSANNYAESIAIWAYGSVPKFLTAARAFLKAHDLDDTTIVDTNGLDSGDRSTPSDLVALGKLVVANPALMSIVSEETATVPHVGLLTNTNTLLGTDGVDGIKTGTTDQAGACLLYSTVITVGARHIRLVAVTLDATTHGEIDDAAVPFIDSIKSGFHDVRLATKGEVFATYTTAWGGVAKAVAAKDVSATVYGKHRITGKVTAADITGGSVGDRVGTVSYVVDGTLRTVPLALDRSVLAAPIWWRLTHPFR